MLWNILRASSDVFPAPLVKRRDGHFCTSLHKLPITRLYKLNCRICGGMCSFTDTFHVPWELLPWASMLKWPVNVQCSHGEFWACIPPVPLIGEWKVRWSVCHARMGSPLKTPEESSSMSVYKAESDVCLTQCVCVCVCVCVWWVWSFQHFLNTDEKLHNSRISAATEFVLYWRWSSLGHSTPLLVRSVTWMAAPLPVLGTHWGLKHPGLPAEAACCAGSCLQQGGSQAVTSDPGDLSV